MKITLDIPNEHAPRLLALLADLMPVRLEPQSDPAEGHPELPLDDESEAIAETRWAPVQGIDAADPLKVEMDAEPVTPPQSFENASTVPPVVGERFWMRNGEVVKVVARNAKLDNMRTEFEAVNDNGTRYYFNKIGKHCYNNFFDLVQRCPF